MWGMWFGLTILLILAVSLVYRVARVVIPYYLTERFNRKDESL